MSAKRLVGMVVSLVFFASFAFAQVNELAITGGRSFVSTQTATSGDLIHFGNAGSIAFNYARLLKTHKIFGLYAEVPVAIYPRMDLHYEPGTVPKDVGALFVTPSARLNIFSGDSVTPWVSVGGGFGHFRQAPITLYENPNPGPGGTNTGVLQFGAGLDVWFWHRWGVRSEARDFYSGNPSLNVMTSNSRQHNYYVGVGVTHRF